MDIQHKIFGTGATHVIVLNGWFGSSQGWEQLIPCLDGKAFTYAFMDYRGYGKSKDVKGEFTLDEIADDVLMLADNLGWKTFNLVGHSMGGMFIQKVLVTVPGRVEKLVALTPVPASGVPLDEDGTALFYGAVGEIGNRIGIIDFTTGNRNKADWVQKIADHSWANSTPEAFEAYLRLWTGEGIGNVVDGNETPLLAVVGEHDPALTKDVIEATFMKSYPNSELHIMGNAGHYPMDETPVQLATVVERFLAG